MSTPITDDNQASKSAAMYAPPWARDAARQDAHDVRPTVRDVACGAIEQALADAPVAAAENAVAASEQFRRTLPPASKLDDRRTRRREMPFEGDVAIVHMRERPTLDPDAVPTPPIPERRSSIGLFARVAGAVGLAALAAFFMVGTTPFSFAVKAEGEVVSPSLWSRLAPKNTRQQATEVVTPRPPVATPAAPLAERFAAMPPPMVERPVSLPTRAIQTVAIPAEPPVVAPEPKAQPEPAGRAIDREEIATLYRRSQDLIAQGDIAGGRLLLTRAAESGDPRSALALGAAYDPAVLGKMGVLGVMPDREKARIWYERAAQFGSNEATKRLEHLAQTRR